MSVSASQSFIEARANLQAESSRILPRIRQKIQPHRHSFIWQMDKGLENSLFGTPIEQAANAVLTPEQVRIIARENGKTYSYACMAVTPKILALSSNIERLSSGSLTLQEELNSFRSLVERLSVLEAVLNNLSTLTNKSSVKTYDDLIEIREVFSKLVVTRFDWSKLQLLDFSEMPLKTDYQHDASETRVDLTATSALSQIDKLQKQGKYKGIRPFYNFCCEFVHPNIGDILATTLEKKHSKLTAVSLRIKLNTLRIRLRPSQTTPISSLCFQKLINLGPYS